jgi:hypothetical protein
LRNGDTNIIALSYSNASISYTPTTDIIIDTIRLFNGGTNFDNYTFSVQLNVGLDTEYEPYYHADYPINLGNIELCKIGNYQDYLYKENGNWYKYGAIDKYVYNNDLTSNGLSEEQVSMLTPALNVTGGLSGNQLRDMSYCNMMKTTAVNHTGLNGTFSSKKIRVNVSTDYATSYNGARQLYADNNLTIYFVAEEPVITQITDTTLISQLDAIYEHFKLTKGINNITVTASDLAPYMKLSYMQDLPTKLNNLDSRLALLE